MKRLVINYNGFWDESEYRGGKQLFVPVDKDIEFTVLLDLIYDWTKIDITKYALLIEGVALTRRCAPKYDIRNDSDVRFMLANEKYDSEILSEEIEKKVQHADEDEETKKRQKKIYAAAVKGKLDREANAFFERHPSDDQAELLDLRDNALHIALKVGNNEFVTELMRSKYMGQVDFNKKDGSGNTPFFLAVMLGNTILVALMLNEDEDLVKSRDSSKMFPIQVAAMLGNEKMVKYLYPLTNYMFIERNCEDHHHITKRDLVELLIRLIENDLYDYARSIVKEFPWLAVGRDKDDKPALHALVKKPLSSHHTDKDDKTALRALVKKRLTSHYTANSNQGILKRFYYRSFTTRA